MILNELGIFKQFETGLYGLEFAKRRKEKDPKQVKRNQKKSKPKRNPPPAKPSPKRPSWS